MKRSKFTSFLFTIALGLFAFNFASAQTSADCQDEVNISLGAECNTAIPYEAFNTWKPSCMTIVSSSGMQMAAITGTGSGTWNTNKLSCRIAIDSFYLDTIVQSKVTVYKVDAWNADCIPSDGMDTIYADLSKIPTVCNGDTLYTPTHGFIDPAKLASTTKLVGVWPKACNKHLDSTLVTDGKLFIKDSVTTYSIKVNKKTVYRVDTFSHTEPLRWVKGTQLIPIGSNPDSVVHGATPATKVTKSCEFPSQKDLFGTPLAGPARLKPGSYTYNSYTQDSLNFCWGKINLEYKLWPSLDGRNDTLNCVDFSDFDRSETYDYTPKTYEKLEDVCKWAEAVVRVDNSSPVPDVTAIRTDARIAYLINTNIAHCYTHTVTHKDKWVRNFDWLCDTVVKERIFFTDHPGHGSADVKELTRDSLWIEPIILDSVRFPDVSVVMKCGIIAEDGPDHIAEYLYHAVKKLGTKKKVLYAFDATAANDKKYAEELPCTLFASQYEGGKSGAADCKKMFQHSSYNNWGVKKAFPYVQRIEKIKAIDKGLKAKFGSSAGVMDSLVYIPINKIVCNIAASKTDLHPVEVCPGEKKIFRTWTLVDWCTGTIRDTTQIIKFVDIEAPTVSKLDHKSITIAEVDDDNSKGREDHYFGRVDLSNHDANDDLTDGSSSNDGNAKTDIAHHKGIGVHWIKVTNPWGCYATHTFPKPTVTEHCSEWSHTYSLHKDDDVLTQVGGTFSAGDSEGIHWEHGKGLYTPVVKLRLWDECGNDFEYFYYLKAIDKIPPIVVLHDELVVTLTSNNEDFEPGTLHTEIPDGEGIAKIYCKDVDAGSHDGDCGALLACAIRVKDSGDDWADYVHFTCEDVGEVEVEYRATDWSGNTSVGWMKVTVENKNGPYIVCEDVVIDCVDPIHPDWVGYPHVYGICDDPSLTYEDEYNVDDLCFKGYIKRTWTVTDANSGKTATCTQTITISDKDNGGDNSVFNPTTIHWPLHNTGESLEDMGLNTDWIKIKDKDAHGNCNTYSYSGYNSFRKASDSKYDIKKDVLQGCKMDDYFECSLGNLKEPTWTDPACGLVGKTFEDQHVKFNDGVCFKILRTWVVIDWCTYDPKVGDKYPEQEGYLKDRCDGKSWFYSRVKDGTGHDEEDERDGYYSHVQVIKVVDETAPVITVEKEYTVEVGAGSKTDDDACEGSIIITASAEDFCLGDLVVGVDDTKEEGPELDWFYKLVQVDKDGNELKEIHGFKPIKDAQGGNEVGHETLYSDENQSPSAAVEVKGAAHEHYHVKWRVEDGCNNAAEAISKVSFKDVKAPVLLCYADLSTNAMSTNGEAEIWASDYGHAYDCDGESVDVWFKDADGNLTPAITFTCDDLGGNVAATKEFRVYARDKEGNEGFCEVTLRIADSNNACGNSTGASAVIAGKTYTEGGDMVESALISMGDHSKMTGVTGEFAFANNPMGLDYTINAAKNDDHLNGVSTLDLVLIQKHILGLDLLDSPFKVIAADINNDQGVSAIDLVELRKVILGITNEFTNNTSWRFGDAGQTFEDNLNPFATFTEAINVDFLVESVNRDFISIKVGDVSGNAIANSAIVGSRSNTSMAFTALDQDVSAGDVVNVTIGSDEFISMNAFQFTLNLSGLEFTGVRSGAIEMKEENVAVFGDALTAAWTNVNATTSSDELFTLEFRALVDTRLSNAISMGSSRTDARAYNSDLEQFETSLLFNSEDGSTLGAAFELMQNTPNPFQNTTSIGFELGEAGPATLTVFDVTGKTVRVEAGNFARGYNEITLTKADLGTSGVLYYQLESGDFTATRKMILID